MNFPTDFFTAEFKKLPPPAQRAVWRFIWRLGIVAWIAWAMGAFAAIGLPGFVRAAEVTEMRTEIAEMKASADISARLSLANEIRLYQRTLCTAPDRDAIERAIDRLQIEYQRLNNGVRYPDRTCPTG